MIYQLTTAILAVYATGVTVAWISEAHGRRKAIALAKSMVTAMRIRAAICAETEAVAADFVLQLKEQTR